MATAAQCLANAANAQHSTGPSTEEGKAKVAKNGVRHGLFAAYERLAPAEAARVAAFVHELSEGFAFPMVEQHGDGILMGAAFRRDAAGPNALAKLMRYEARVMKELARAKDGYYKILEIMAAEKGKANCPPAIRKPATSEAC